MSGMNPGSTCLYTNVLHKGFQYCTVFNFDPPAIPIPQEQMLGKQTKKKTLITYVRNLGSCLDEQSRMVLNIDRDDKLDRQSQIALNWVSALCILTASCQKSTLLPPAVYANKLHILGKRIRMKCSKCLIQSKSIRKSKHLYRQTKSEKRFNFPSSNLLGLFL